MKWSELKIYQFQELYSILTDKELDELGKVIYSVAFLEEKTVAEIESMNLDEFKKLSDKYGWLKEMDLLEKISNTFELNGEIYKVIWQVDKMKAGQYIDLTEFNKDPMANIHKVMATLVYKDWNTYATEHNERSELFRKEMNIGFAYPLCVFFCERLTKSMPGILKAMQKDLKRKKTELQLMLLQQRIASSHIGAGVTRFINYLKGQARHGNQ